MCKFTQRIVDGLRLTECDDSGISRHGVSLLSGGFGRLDTRLDTPPSINRRHPDSGLSILSKPVALLGATELRKWRDSLLDKGLAPGTVNRTKTGLRAALELAAAHDPRITNQRAWKVGLAALPDAHRARNVILDDATVR